MGNLLCPTCYRVSQWRRYGPLVEFADDLVHTGHFVFGSGYHGDTRLELDLLVSRPARLRELSFRLGDRLREYDVDLVCGPLEGGAFVAQWIAASLGIMFSYARREYDSDRVGPAGRANLAGGASDSGGDAAGVRYRIPPSLSLTGLRAALVDDAIDRGSAALATARELAGRGCELAVIGSLLVGPAGVRLGRRLGVPQEYLIEVESRSWPAEECPLCRTGTPIER